MLGSGSARARARRGRGCTAGPACRIGAEGFRCALLVRRSLAKPAELTFYLTQHPRAARSPHSCRWRGHDGASRACSSRPSRSDPSAKQRPAELAEGARWALTNTRCAPGSTGTHATLSMFALATLAAVRKAAVGGMDPTSLAADLLPLTVPEVRRLLAALVPARPSKPATVLRWSTWRQRHQHRARRAHWHRRTQTRTCTPAVVLGTVLLWWVHGSSPLFSFRVVASGWWSLSDHGSLRDRRVLPHDGVGSVGLVMSTTRSI